MKKDLERFQELSRELTDLGSVLSTLSWDQETMMPTAAAPFRARQLATLSSLRHQKLTAPEFGELLEKLAGAELDIWNEASVREAGRDYKKAIKLPPALVRELAETCSLAYHAWVEAKDKSDFASFAPLLEKVVSLKKEEARCLAENGSLYDALLDEYEPEMTSPELEALFRVVRPVLSEMTNRIQNSPHQPRPEILKGSFPLPRQEQFGREVLTRMGFDWKSGRLDQSPHPFCIGVTPLDVRITTRYSEDDFSTGFFGIIHEGGHALYEQGLDVERFGMIACETISLGIHESQSRLWEIYVARGKAFWEYWYPRLGHAFNGQFPQEEIESFLHAINTVKPTLVRVDADEVTYGLHVILRYEIEKAMIEDDLPTSELEDVWNSKMEEYLGIVPERASEGVLQDVHWAHGLIGYFPTYLLGTIYAAQLFEAADSVLGDLTGLLRQGELAPLRDWLRESVHRPGKTLNAGQLLKKVTGSAVRPEPFLTHLEHKYRELYRL